MEESVSNNPDTSEQANAISLFGPGGAGNDFPVLKAFQQYIDAEQAKARKRMLGLSAFFVVLLLVVVITFTLITVAVINRNQALSDRLLDIALRDKGTQQPVVNVQPPPQTIVQPAAQEASIMKPILEKLESLATAMVSAKQQPAPAPTPVVVTTSAPINPSYQPVESAETLQLREELKKQQEALKAEIAKMKSDRAKMDAEEQKKAAIEQHRRRLYPEYYAREDAKKAAELAREKGAVPSSELPPPSVLATPAVKRPAIQQTMVPAPKSEPVKKGATVPSKPVDATAKPSKKVGAIDYFSASEDDDEELRELLRKSKQAPRTAPKVQTPPPPAKKDKAPSSSPAAAVSKSASTPVTQTLNVGKTEEDSIPWIVNVPDTKNK